jgi:predicted metal-dependent hydrolase
MPRKMNLPPNMEVRRTGRRKKTVAAVREGQLTVLYAPLRMPNYEIEEMAQELQQRLDQIDPRAYYSDQELLDRAEYLSANYLFSAAQPKSVAWSEKLTSAWGICNPLHQTINLATRLKGLPQYVIDYVLLHELVHLVCTNHGKEFDSFMKLFEKKERAEGYLDALDELGSSDSGLSNSERSSGIC